MFIRKVIFPAFLQKFHTNLKVHLLLSQNQFSETITKWRSFKNVYVLYEEFGFKLLKKRHISRFKFIGIC